MDAQRGICDQYQYQLNSIKKYEKQTQTEASVFFDIIGYLQHGENPPWIMFLENVFGVLKRAKSTGLAPLDFLMNGSAKIGGEWVNVGTNSLNT